MEDYVRFLVRVANEKMEANRRRTEGFFQALLGSNNGFVEPRVLLNGDNENHGGLEKTEDSTNLGN